VDGLVREHADCINADFAAGLMVTIEQALWSCEFSKCVHRPSYSAGYGTRSLIASRFISEFHARSFGQKPVVIGHPSSVAPNHFVDRHARSVELLLARSKSSGAVSGAPPC